MEGLKFDAENRSNDGSNLMCHGTRRRIQWNRCRDRYDRCSKFEHETRLRSICGSKMMQRKRVANLGITIDSEALKSVWTQTIHRASRRDCRSKSAMLNIDGGEQTWKLSEEIGCAAWSSWTSDEHWRRKSVSVDSGKRSIDGILASKERCGGPTIGRAIFGG